EQTANILGKVSETNWDDIQPENHKLLFFACRQYLGVCLQRQVGLENLLAKKINHKLENTQPYQNKEVALDSDETCKSLILNQRSSIEDAIECTSETLTSLYATLFEIENDESDDEFTISPVKRRRAETKSKMTVESTVPVQEVSVAQISQDQDGIPVKNTKKGAPELECKKCGLSCRTPSALNTHWRTHTKIKPYVCTFCGSDHTQKNQLLVHTKTHHPEHENAVRIKLEEMKKDLKCYCCLANFTNQKDLTVHIIDCASNSRWKTEQIEPSARPYATLSIQRPILPKPVFPTKMRKMCYSDSF
ncbi:unnamed protein product, partial [Oikopleura dioica]